MLRLTRLAAEALWLVDRPNRATIDALAALLKDLDEHMAGQAALDLGPAGGDAKVAIPLPSVQATAMRRLLRHPLRIPDILRWAAAHHNA